ncbi:MULTISPECIES: hypothetical protein [unclassified Streptomyces]|uniref:hypothetical protein n=1 Tax=unclassified Streptomyces TaxID=2593676 RepID=UPI00168A4721|nr:MULTISPECIES: hypothetical protein [unclassified Streptomyces]MBD3003888.1 hypothetical protein [Streptomyces sp. 5-10]
MEIRIPTVDHLTEAIAPLQPALEHLEAMTPVNWRGSRLAYSKMIALMQEGVPLAWVPPAEIIQQLLAANGPASRAQLIDERRPTIPASCEAGIASVRRHPVQRTEDTARRVRAPG